MRRRRLAPPSAGSLFSDAELVKYAELGERVNAFIRTFGRRWATAPLPDGVLHSPDRHCFENATVLAHHRCDLTYVEGCVLGGLPHAWCVDSRGVVVDPTWPLHVPPPDDYDGVAFRTAWVIETVVNSKLRHFGVIFSVELGNPALSVDPRKTLDPRWWPADPRPVSSSSTDITPPGSLRIGPASRRTGPARRQR